MLVSAREIGHKESESGRKNLVLFLCPNSLSFSFPPKAPSQRAAQQLPSGGHGETWGAPPSPHLCLFAGPLRWPQSQGKHREPNQPSAPAGPSAPCWAGPGPPQPTEPHPAPRESLGHAWGLAGCCTNLSLTRRWDSTGTVLGFQSWLLQHATVIP